MSHKPSPSKLSQDTVDGTSKLLGVILFVLLLAFCWALWFIISIALEGHSQMEFIIADASITEFNFTSDNTLYYNFKLNISVRNPNNDNEYMGMVHAISSYKGNKFGAVDIISHKLYGRTTNFLRSVVFYGNNLIKLNAQKFIEYENEMRLGIFNLDLKLDIILYSEPVPVYCLGLRVPLISIEKLESIFNITKCSREYQGWW
ncbi:NDR1/HIN1-like protein 10 [Vicia villosa]|uniref:NDR1/HIN1-like protein 10 n=1 Tax=Vicia villosa TaxID=3911 RepID=UPI00273A83E4|nr:NDR1/HIN1-like protein 10 [Vicia villosa]